MFEVDAHLLHHSLWLDALASGFDLDSQHDDNAYTLFHSDTIPTVSIMLWYHRCVFAKLWESEMSRVYVCILVKNLYG